MLIENLKRGHQYLLEKVIRDFHFYSEKMGLSEVGWDNRMGKIIEITIEMNEYLSKHFQLEDSLFDSFLQKTKPYNFIEETQNIKIILMEHDQIRKYLNEIRILCDQFTPPRESRSSVKLLYAQLFNIEQDVKKHMFIQEDILFPKILSQPKS